MSLAFATLCMGLLCVVVGIGTLSPIKPTAALNRLRSLAVTRCAWGAATAWFLWRVAHLSEADFGQYKHALLVFFGVVALLAYTHLPDWLSVRALAVLGLLWSDALLDAAYMQPTSLRLMLVTGTYGLIALCLLLGTLPYSVRVVLDLWHRVPLAQKVCGWMCCAYGVVLALMSVLYPECVR